MGTKNRSRSQKGGTMFFVQRAQKHEKANMKKGIFSWPFHISIGMVLFFIGLYIYAHWGEFSVWMKASILDDNCNGGSCMSSSIEIKTGVIIPILDCIDRNADGSVTAHFGYDNQSQETMFIDVGSSNQFSPAPQFREQPTVFSPGMNKNIFDVTFTDQHMTWSLKSMGGQERSVTATHNTPQCSLPASNSNSF